MAHGLNWSSKKSNFYFQIWRRLCSSSKSGRTVFSIKFILPTEVQRLTQELRHGLKTQERQKALLSRKDGENRFFKGNAAKIGMGCMDERKAACTFIFRSAGCFFMRKIYANAANAAS